MNNDVITFGETMIRLSAPETQRIVFKFWFLLKI